ncbi:MAG: hypothetical protein IJ555_01365 [Ruminococcus sp.]|nr:hypothetical protein [Ruminococcus sp.]MBR1752552.1 hypothetical protein [Ruminococcus sp.]
MKISKILFYLSFAPAVLLLISAVMSMFTGATFMFSTDYGVDAFLSTIILGGMALCYIPVLPACAIYQIVYFLLFIMPKGLPGSEAADNTEAQESEPRGITAPRFNISTKTKTIIAVSLFAAMALGILGWLFKPKIEGAIEKHKAQRMYENAEVRLDYNKSHEYMGGILGIEEQKYACVLIDYDTMRTGFITGDVPGYQGYIEFDLTETDKESADKLKDKYIVQTQTTLPDGGTFTAFRTQSGLRAYTKALLLEKSDGSIYINDDLGTSDGAFTELWNAFEAQTQNNE